MKYHIVVMHDAPNVVVSSWREAYTVTRELVRRSALHQQFLPIKTSRHIVEGIRVICNIDLDRLGHVAQI